MSRGARGAGAEKTAIGQSAVEIEEGLGYVGTEHSFSGFLTIRSNPGTFMETAKNHPVSLKKNRTTVLGAFPNESRMMTPFYFLLVFVFANISRSTTSRKSATPSGLRIDTSEAINICTVFTH